MALMVGVIGAGRANEVELTHARDVGRLIARHGDILVCGGLGGVMEAAAAGAREAGGITVGILPQGERKGANPYIDIPIATGFGEGRNVVLVRTSDLLIAVGGEYGTLSEIALALKLDKVVVGIDSWDIEGVLKASRPEEAFAIALSHGALGERK